MSFSHLGVQVGDVTAKQGFVSLQTVAEQVTGSLMQADGDKWVEHSNGAEVSEEETVQFELSNFRLILHTVLCVLDESGERSAVTRFRSGLGNDDWRSITFGGCIVSGGNLPWETFTRAAEEQLDFFLLLGDTVYTNARSYSTALNDWKRALKVQGMEDLTQSTSIVATWDDHELVNNFDWDLIDNPEEVHDNAWRAFQKAIPMDKEQTAQCIERFLMVKCVMSSYWIVEESVVVIRVCISRREQLDWLKSSLAFSGSF